MHTKSKGPAKKSAASSGGGMPYFEKDHWQRDLEDVNVGGTRYNPSEMNQVGEYKEMVDKQAAYLKKHKAQH